MLSRQIRCRICCCYLSFLPFISITKGSTLSLQLYEQRMAVDEGEGVARESVGVATGSSIGAGVWDSCTDWALHAPQTGKGNLFWAFFFFLQFYFNNAAFPDFNSVNTCPWGFTVESRSLCTWDAPQSSETLSSWLQVQVSCTHMNTLPYQKA